MARVPDIGRSEYPLQKLEIGKAKRDFSLRKPTTSQERGGQKRRRLAPLEM